MTNQITELTPEFVIEIPEIKQSGMLYISDEYGLAIHLCPCGCGNQSVLPFKKEMQTPSCWELVNKNGLVTFIPSIINNNCPNRSHYFIRDNKIIL